MCRMPFFCTNSLNSELVNAVPLSYIREAMSCKDQTEYMQEWLPVNLLMVCFSLLTT